MKTAIFAGALLTISMFGLAACSQEAEEAAPAEPDAPEGISVENARLMLPAVSGNPGAVYFDLKNDSERNVMVRAVNVEGAGSAVMHTMGTWNLEPVMNEVLQIDAPAGSTLEFKPGDLHVMAMDLDESVQAGGTSEVTLTFVGGDKISFPAEVRAAGDER